MEALVLAALPDDVTICRSSLGIRPVRTALESEIAQSTGQLCLLTVDPNLKAGSRAGKRA